MPDDIRFELQGVLVKGDEGLYELPMGTYPTALDMMRPFRLAHGIGILAEYRVFLSDSDPGWVLQASTTVSCAT